MGFLDKLINLKKDQSSLITGLVTAQLKKICRLVTPPVAKEIDSCLASCPIEAIVNTKAEKAFADMRPHSDYYSPPDSPFAVSIMVVPCALHDARTYFLRQYPKNGFAGIMEKTAESTMVKLEQQAGRTKKGIIFVIVCRQPNSNRCSVNLALCPTAEEFVESVPLVVPGEFVPNG